MKLNLKTISLGGVAALTLLATPLVATRIARADGECGARFEQLNLTDEQSSQIQAIKDDAREEMQAVLTSEQRATLENNEGEGRRAWRSLDLNEAQRDQLRAIKEASREEVQSVLTDDQRQQIEEIREERGARREGRRDQREDRS